MRRLVVTEFLSLDGVMDTPSWSAEYWNDDIAAFKGSEQEAADALLLGRITYEGFAQAWPGRTEPGADKMNGMPKYVVSTTLTTADWNNSSIISQNVPEEVARLKQSEGADILVYGSGALIDTLRQAGLVDEYRLLVYPVLVGQGKRLFKDNETAKLKLVNSQIFDNGVLALVYHPA